MNKTISEYATLVFDCDGVVLNSNKIKTQAFYEATKHYGHEAAQKLVEYHIKNGGVSRYLKLEYFINDILGDEVTQEKLDSLIQNFANEVKNGLLKCEIAEGILELRKKTSNANWLIVSGGDQEELREIFSIREIDVLFDGGIFGSPDNKEFILEREIKNGNINSNAIFLGDSKYDFKAAQHAQLDFVFLNSWTEVKDWNEFCQKSDIKSYGFLKDLL